MLSIVLLASPNVSFAVSYLDGIVERLATTDFGVDILLMANIAETTGTQITVKRELRVGDRVVIGYDTNGTPVYGTAFAGGILVAPSLSSSLAVGLSAGTYPIGSALYALPTGALYSLVEADVTGANLDLASETVGAKIDGRVTTIARSSAMSFPDVTELVTSELLSGRVRNAVDMGEIRTSVLGAVNAGQAITQVTLSYDTGPIGVRLDALPAMVARGASQSVALARTNSSSALSLSENSLRRQKLIANIAANNVEVIGFALTEINDLSASLNRQITTVLGAVNSGIIIQMNK